MQARHIAYMRRRGLQYTYTSAVAFWVSATGTSSGTSARKRKTSESPCWNPQTATPTPSAIGPSSFDSPRQYLNRLRWKNPLHPKSDCTSLQHAVYFLICSTQSGSQKAYEGPPPPSPCGPLIQAVRRESRRSGH